MFKQNNYNEKNIFIFLNDKCMKRQKSANNIFAREANNCIIKIKKTTRSYNKKCSKVKI